jgi:hypothetical protein
VRLFHGRRCRSDFSQIIESDRSLMSSDEPTQQEEEPSKNYPTQAEPHHQAKHVPLAVGTIRQAADEQNKKDRLDNELGFLHCP